MAKPIIFTLLLGNNDQILEKINTQETQNLPTIVLLKTNKESHISDKDRIFAEMLRESIKQGKDPIFNAQLNNNNIKPIFQSQDLTNLQNLNIKSTITFDHYNSLAGNPELANYWRELLAKANHVFFANKEEQELAINENIVSRDKTTSIKDTDIDSVISVFNNLTDGQKVNKLLSDIIPDKTNLNKIINTAKNQGGRVVVKAWPLSLDEATNLIVAKFGIKSDDQIYGLKLEINEILKDPNNAAENLQKYVSQISEQFQKERGITEINPIDFNFDKKKVMKNKSEEIQKESTISHEPVQKNQPKPGGFFRKVFNYFKNAINNIFSKKEAVQTFQATAAAKQKQETEELVEKPQQEVTPTLTQQTSANISEPQASQVIQNIPFAPPAPNSAQYDHFRIPLEVNDINDVKKPNHWYENHQIQYILEESLNKNDFSVHAPISLNQNININLLPADQNPENVLKNAVSQVIEGKKAAVIPIEMGYGHWTGLVATYDKKDNQVILTFNDSLGNSINYDGQKLPKLIGKALSDLPNKPIIIDEQTKQQNNNLDCGVFTTDNLIKLANGKPILSTEEAKNEAQNLRNQHAAILTRAMDKERVQEIGRQSKNKQPANFQKLVESRRNNDKELQR